MYHALSQKKAQARVNFRSAALGRAGTRTTAQRARTLQSAAASSVDCDARYPRTPRRPLLLPRLYDRTTTRTTAAYSLNPVDSAHHC